MATGSTSPTSPDRGHGTMTVSRAVSLGIGSMVGAGIFALLGQVGAIAGSGVWLAFLIGGVVALLNGYSYGRLGATYPSAGGPVDYLTRGFGTGVFSGGLSVFYYAAGLIGMAMVARAFGSYGAATISSDPPPAGLAAGLAVAIVIALPLVNAAGSALVGKIELVVVGLKLTILGVFVVGGTFGISSSLLTNELNISSPSSVVLAIGLAFFAYTGFGVVTNSAADMANPERELPRALTISISMVIVLYIAIAVVAFGSLSVAQIVQSKDTALAVAARPVFGRTGFTVMAIAAMLSTASALNASLYGSTNVSYVLAKQGELPERFDRRGWHAAPEGLYITAVIVIVLATVLDLSQIASLGSLGALIVYLAVGVGHYRVRTATRAKPTVLLLAIAATAATTGIFIVRLATDQPFVLALGILVLAAAFAAEGLLRRSTGRVIGPGKDFSQPAT